MTESQKEFEQHMVTLGYYEVTLGKKNISWTKNNLKNMLKAQKELNDYLICSNFVIPDKHKEEFKNAFKQLHKDITIYDTSICYICGDKQSIYTHMNIEHMKMNVSWGYESTHDTETHSLILCNKCYDERIMNESLGKYIKITNYM